MQRNFAQFLSYVGRYTCLFFTVILTLLAIANLSILPGSIGAMGILQVLLQSVFAAVLSYLVFSDCIIRRGSAALRYFVYLLILLPELWLANRVFGWYGGEYAVPSMLIFSFVCILVIYGVLALADWLRRRQYDEKLREYHEKRGR